jgi:hypothetical protein
MKSVTDIAKRALRTDDDGHLVMVWLTSNDDQSAKCSTSLSYDSNIYFVENINLHSREIHSPDLVTRGRLCLWVPIGKITFKGIGPKYTK